MPCLVTHETCLAPVTKRLIRDQPVAINGRQHLQRGICGRPESRLPAGQQRRPCSCQISYRAVRYVLLYAIIGNSAYIGPAC